MNIKVIADSTCDLPQELLQKYDISITPLYIIKDGKDFRDGITITPKEIFDHVAAGGDLCTTSAVSVGEYQDIFARYAPSYDAVIQVNIGSGFSACYQNACLAAADFDNVLVIDSQNLCMGQGCVVLEVCRLAQECTSLEEIREKIQDFIPRVEISFVLEHLAYMVKGGRCSSATALGANLLNLKPCLEVKDGKLSVVKKYRGSFPKCIAAYCKDRLTGREDVEHSTGWLLYTQVEDEIVAQARKDMEAFVQPGPFGENVAGCTISCHCGPGTLGLVVIRK